MYISVSRTESLLNIISFRIHQLGTLQKSSYNYTLLSTRMNVLVMYKYI